MKKSLKSNAKKIQNSFIFYNFVKTRDAINKIAKLGLLKTVLLFVLMTGVISVNGQNNKRFDLAFDGVFPSESCEKMMSVSLTNINDDTLLWKVQNLRIYINYDADIVINQYKTSGSLNHNLSDYYSGAPNGDNPPDPIVTYETSQNRISIIANLKDDGTIQELGNITDLITIYFSGSPSMSVNFTFEYDNPLCFINALNPPDNPDIELLYPKKYDDQGYDIMRNYTFEAPVANYDLVFGGINECKLPQVNVKLDDIEHPDWKVNNLKIFIKYDTDISIDEFKTKESLNNKIKANYGGYGADIVRFLDHEIVIEAQTINEMKEIDEIKDIITIYFNGNIGSSVTFTFSYDSPHESSLDLVDDMEECYKCIPYETNENRIRDYDLGAEVNNYDLLFGEVEQDEEQCELNKLDVNIFPDEMSTDINVKHVLVKIYYTFPSSVTVDEEKTQDHLNLQLKSDQYEGEYRDKVYFVSNGSERSITIDVKVKENGQETTLQNISNLITIYFKGDPGDYGVFSFSSINPYSLILLSDANSCFKSYPQQINEIHYNFDQALEVGGKIWTISDGKQKGKCNTVDVSVMKGVEVDYYNMDTDPLNPFCYYTTDDTGEFACDVTTSCTKRIVPKKEICAECGITMADIDVTVNAILGIERFKYAYQPFVADVNESGTITGNDVFLMNSILLGTYPPDKYPDFKFIPANVFEQFELSGNYGTVVPDYNPYIEFVDPPSSVDFYAFKSADVEKNNLDDNDLGCDHCIGCDGGEAGSGGYTSTMERKIIDLQMVENKGLLVATATTLNKDSFNIMGAYIQVEPKGIELDTVLFYDSEKDMSGYSYNKETGVLKIIWINKNSYTSNISLTDKLYDIVFLKDKYSAQDISFSIEENINLNISIKNDKTAYKTSLKEKLEPRYVQKPDFVIVPSIFDNNISVNCYVDKQNSASFVFYNSWGKTIYRKLLTLNKGYNKVVLDNMQDIPEGIIYYKAIIDNKAYSGKLIKVNN